MSHSEKIKTNKKTIEVDIPRGRTGLNYLPKFVCTKWAV